MKHTKSIKSGLESGMILPIYSDYKTNITPNNIECYAKLIELDINTEPLTFIIRDEPDCRQTIYSAERWLVELSSNHKTYRYIRYNDRNTIHSSAIKIKKLNIVDDIEFSEDHVDILSIICKELYPNYAVEIKPKNLAVFKAISSICIDDYEKIGCKYWRNLMELSLYYIPNIFFRKNPTEYINFLKKCIVLQETHPVIYLEYYYNKNYKKEQDKNNQPEQNSDLKDDYII